MRDAWAVLVGGAAGSLVRYGLAQWGSQAWGTRLPWGVMVANVVGSVLIGWVVTWFGRHPVEWPWRPLLVVGFLGGLTTFSSLAYDTASLAQRGEMGNALWNLGLNLGLGFAGVALGMWLGSRG